MVDVTSLETSFGTLLLAANEHGLCRLVLPSAQEHARFQEWITRRTPPHSLPQDAKTHAFPSPLMGEGQGEGASRLKHDRTPPLSSSLPRGEREQNAFLALAKKELSEYLVGARRHFTVPLALEGSAFFQQVWDALVGIPYGHTMTYAALATTLQRPRAFRAVGSACAKNPVPLIIPCHRAVGSNGSLTGFAGGLAMKEALLRMESAIGG